MALQWPVKASGKAAHAADASPLILGGFPDACFQTGCLNPSDCLLWGCLKDRGHPPRSSRFPKSTYEAPDWDPA